MPNGLANGIIEPTVTYYTHLSTFLLRCVQSSICRWDCQFSFPMLYEHSLLAARKEVFKKLIPTLWRTYYKVPFYQGSRTEVRHPLDKFTRTFLRGRCYLYPTLLQLLLYHVSLFYIGRIPIRWIKLARPPYHLRMTRTQAVLLIRTN